MLKKKIVAALLVALFLVGFVNVGVTVYAISPSIHVYEGQSIQAAIDVADEGAMIIVHAGTYHESLSVYKGLKILGLHAVIDLEGTGLNTAIYVHVGGVAISGFIIRNIPAVAGAAAIHYPVPGLGISGGLIENNIISSGFNGIILNGPSNVRIRNNWIAAVYPVWTINAPNVIIENNVMSAHNLDATTGVGISVRAPASTPILRGSIRYNVIYSEYLGIRVNRQSDVKIKGNMIMAVTGIIANGAPNVVVEENAIHADDVGMSVVNAADATVKKNIIYISKEAQGVSPPYWIGIFFTGTGSNIAENRISGNFEYGISIGAYDVPDDPLSTGNTVCRNRITGGVTANDVGVYLDVNTSENSVVGNGISGVDTPISDNGLNNQIIS